MPASNDVVAVLAERNGAVLAARIRELGPDGLTTARARFDSFGTCSVTEPLDKLVELGLPVPVTESEGVPA
jgi:hypothetical protein